MNCFIVHGNHYEGKKAISDLSQNLVDSLECLNLFPSIQFSKNIVPNSINFIIEEFSNQSFCVKLEKTKKKFPKTIIFLIITEIPINKSFNNFNNTKFKENISSNKYYNYKFYYYQYLIKWKLIKK